MNTAIITKVNLLHNFRHSYTSRVLGEAWDLFLQLWPFIIIGILITAIAKVFISKNFISGILIKNSFFAIVVASFIGVISPLGSYVMIPLSVTLLTVGVPLPIVMALVVSSPLINPNLFVLTAGAFGYPFAIVRVIAAMLLGVAAGYCTQIMLKYPRWSVKMLHYNTANANIGAVSLATTVGGTKSFQWVMNDLYKETIKMTIWVGKFFLIAIFIAAFIKIITPPNLIIKLFGQNQFLSVVISTGAGLPFYTCGGAAIPIVQELADLGMNQGSVLAFFISGPVTKISNLVVLKSAYNNTILMIYLTVGIVGAMLFGFIYNLM